MVSPTILFRKSIYVDACRRQDTTSCSMKSITILMSTNKVLQWLHSRFYLDNQPMLIAAEIGVQQAI